MVSDLPLSIHDYLHHCLHEAQVVLAYLGNEGEGEFLLEAVWGHILDSGYNLGKIKTPAIGTREVVQLLRVLVPSPEDLGSILSTYMVAHYCP